MKNINIKNVAEMAHVSISTVSRVLNHSANVSEELKRRVYKAIEETNYRVNPIASTLKSARRNQIAIVLPSLKQTYYTDIIKGLSDYCYERQITPIILETSGEVEKEKTIAGNLEKQWVDGIIFIPSKNASTTGYLEFIDSLGKLRKQGSQIPVVLAECEGLGENMDCVRVDYESAFYKMTYHLLEIGRKRIGYLSAPISSSLYEICKKAYCKAFGDWNYSVEESFIEHSEYTILGGYEAMKRLLQRIPDIDGIICCNDQVASGALHALKEFGGENADRVAIVGFGGVAMSIITTPSITTMIAPRYEIGYKAAEILLNRINGNAEPPQKMILSSHMAIRSSTLRSSFKNLAAMFEE